MILGSVPLSPADLERLRAEVSARWPDVARAAGVRDPGGITVQDGGALWLYLELEPGPEALARRTVRIFARALEQLARVLEDLGYAIDRSGEARRVTGWRTVDGERVVDLRALDVIHAYGDLLFAERMERDREELEKANHPRGAKVEREEERWRRERAAGGR